MSRSELECEKSRAAVQMSDTLKAVVTAIFSSCLQILMLALGQHLENKEFVAHLDDGIARYLYAAALLSFASKEIDRKNLTAVISSLDIIPNQKLVDIILSMKLKSHLGYVYIYYYLLVNGVSVTEEKLVQTAEALGIKGDVKSAAELLKFLQK